MDTIANFLTALLNAQRAGRSFVDVPASRAIFELAQILRKNGYLEAVEKKESANLPSLRLALRYFDRLPALQGARRLSRPGCRLYAKSNELKRLRQGGRLIILTTPKGMMTEAQAREARLGGELICQVW